MIKNNPQNFFPGKPLPIKIFRDAISKMQTASIRPDINGNINFTIDKTGRWHPFDERDSWLSGKPVGGV